jgi:hypothetical protein
LPWPPRGAGTRRHSGPEGAQNNTPKQAGSEVTAEGLATLAGQERIYDSDTFNSWLAAKLDGKAEAAEFFERRFRDEYRPAFTAWLNTDPFNNAQALPGPIFMPDYHNAKHEQFLGLNKKAAEVAEQGTKSGETGDEYVTHHGSPGYRTFNHGDWTTLSFQGRARRLYDSRLPVALPPTFATAHVASHLDSLGTAQ